MDNHTPLEKKKEGFLGQKMIVLPPDALRKILKNVLIQNFHLTAIGHYPNAVFHDRKRTTGSKEYILLYCTEGEGEVSINKKFLPLKPNQFIIVPPNIPHHYRSSVKNPWTIFWVHFTGKRAQFIYNKYANTASPVKFIAYNEEIIKKFLSIIDLLKFSFEERYLEVANINLTQFISFFIYQQEYNSKISEKNMVNKSIEYMKENLHKPLTIYDLAENHNLSVSRYSEIFKENTGHPPIHYFIQLKIQKSCQYLYFTDKNIKEICTLVGFKDPYYFSRMFKKIMDVSPSKYKSTYKS
ncbi:helix-turn-helix domain-containing protein [Zunongwangia atlantica]|uniref:AraC family transcriptional regulator n=1 Tax=Zunongwangia atlantica 22II14-10F7 TaxID=1185767 RepID=A0A1Y1T2F7_9FLAO|nr:helix-turn-helix domain-containing protein [Zunongwangia atlantica]ORL44775.1 AraC family transcriptional regulator [Zunongwangia atlantica 22II14-10F7]